MYQDPNLIFTAPAPVQASVFTPKVTPGRVSGSVSDYREVRLTLTPEALQIEGRVVLPQEQQVPILIVSWFITGWLIAALLLEYAIRTNRTETLAWSGITELVVEPSKQRVCLVYPNPKKPHKQFSLVLKLGESYGEFVRLAEHFLPERVREGKIKGATSPIVWGFLIFLVAFLVFAIVMASLGPRS